jgi:hypothetical protein
MLRAVKRSRPPSMEDRVRDILESLAFRILLISARRIAGSRLADFIADYLMAKDLREAAQLRSQQPSTRASTDVADLARGARRGAEGNERARERRAGGGACLPAAGSGREQGLRH